MLLSRLNRKDYKSILLCIICMITALALQPLVSVQAAPNAMTTNLDLVGSANSQVTGNLSDSTYGWSWDNGAKTLVLEDGFTLNYTAGEKAALRLKADATIILKGSATITTNHKGIDVLGDLTIKSAEGTNGYLKIKLSNKAAAGFGKYYGIELENPEGREVRKLNVKDNTIVEICGSGDGCIYCSAGNAPSNTLATLNITDQSAVQLVSSTSVTSGFEVNNNQRILMIKNGTAPTLLKENETTDISTYSNVTLMSCFIDGEADKEKKNYSLTYDGEEHPVLFNTDEDRLSKLETPIKKIDVTPVNFSYYESLHSEFLDEADSDYREKDVKKTQTQYEPFTAATGSPKNAASYKIEYNGNNIANLIINQRKVVFSGLQAKDKTYDGWEDAEIDYSNLIVTCINDVNSTEGYAASDIEAGKLGKEIVPYAKAFFLAEKSSGENGSAVDNPFGDFKDYVKSANVAYDGTGTSAQKTVAVKKVFIDNTTDVNKIATGVTLSDPNYLVSVPSYENNNIAQIEAEASIYPRSIRNDPNISSEITPSTFKWRAEGYSEENDIEKILKDVSCKTPEHQELIYRLVEDKDYIVNPNTNIITEVGEYEIIITGQGNYAGTIHMPWSIERATREITITEPVERIYNREAYTINAGKKDDDLYYVINDTSDPENPIDITDSLEEGSRLHIIYSGTQLDGTKYEESETAPVNAGTYKVTVSVDETTRYTSATRSLEFTIHPKTVELIWFCSGEGVDAAEAGIKNFVYSGKPYVFTPEVTNNEPEDDVKVTKVVYTGSSRDGQTLNSGNAPWKAGAYSVCAVQLDDANYTVNGTAAHTFTIAQAEVTISWNVSQSPYTFNATDLVPESVVGELCTDAEGNENNCVVNRWSYEGVDVFGNAYTQAKGAVNVSDGTIRVTATSLSNSNYKLPSSEECSAEFSIIPCDLSTLSVGTYDDHEGKSLWAAHLTYTGKIEEPAIIWMSGDGEKQMKNKNGNYTEYTADQVAALIDGYTAGLSTKALEYNKNGMNIKVTGINNFTGENIIPWNMDKLDSTVTITNFKTEGNKPYTITYGEKLPAVEYSYVNEDIRKNLEVGSAPYVSYLYTGMKKNGEEYNSNEAPVEAGEYTLEIKLKETDHYWEATDTKAIVIEQKSVTVDGIRAVDRQYDGTRTAMLDFSAANLTGLVEGDEVTVTEELAKVTDPADGFISYKAEFEGKDVLWGTDAALRKVVKEQTVSVSNCTFTYDDSLPDIFFNYVIADNGNQTEAQAKITCREVVVSGIKAKDRKYNSSKDADLDFSKMIINGAVDGEKLDVEVAGEFVKTGNETAAKDVLIDAETRKPAEKKVNLIYDDDSIVAANKSTAASNYTLGNDTQKESTAVISPETITIEGVKAVDKTYDKSPAVTLDWSEAEAVGASTGDVITLSEANAEWNQAEYDDADVAYDKYGEVIAKTATIPVSRYEAKLGNGSYEKDNYVIGDITFSGKIMPKVLKGISWTFDSESFNTVPEAEFDDNCGILEGEMCEPVVKFFRTSDTEFASPLTKPYMVDDESYVAKVVSVSNKNYTVADDDSETAFTFVYDEVENSPELEITNYLRDENGKAYTVTYGDPLPEIELSYTNTDIAKEDPATRKSHFTYLYSGKALNGTKYESSEAPVDAGSYKVTVNLEATDHFSAGKAVASFVIDQRPIKITQGVAVKSKIYNGTTNAILDFRNVAFDNTVDSDDATLNEIFSENNTECIRYTANYADKNVKLKENAGTEGEADSTVTDIEVTVSDYSIIYNDDTPTVLYNYTIAAEGNVNSLFGKIMPRPVKVTGIKAKNKYYDGTDVAVLSTGSASFEGKLKGDVLDIDATGKYLVTDGEPDAADVILDKTNAARDKKVVITINGIISGDGDTRAENYTVDTEGSQIETTSRIIPREITIASGLTARDKVYNGSVAAEIDFSKAVYNGIMAGDTRKLNALIEGDGKSCMTYTAEFANKNVAYADNTNAGLEIAAVKVTAKDYVFALNDKTPQLMKNYIIGEENNQTEFTGRIVPRPVTVSGIKAADKVYDGTDAAAIDVSAAAFDGIITGDSLSVDAAGAFTVTGNEKAAKDVLVSAGGVQAKNVAITIKGIKAGNNATNANNYCLAESGNQIIATAKINPASLTAVNWTLNSSTHLPEASFDEQCGIIRGSGDICTAGIKYYASDDNSFAKVLTVNRLSVGEAYKARVETCDNANYKLADTITNPVYMFTYGTKLYEDPMPTNAEMEKSVRLMNKSLYFQGKNNNKKLCFRWGAVADADSYYVYVGTLKGSYNAPVKIKGKTSYTFKCKSNTKYKAYVKAVRLVNGKEVVLGQSLVLSYGTKGIEGYNAQKVAVDKKSLTLKAGQTKSLKSSAYVYKTVNGKRKLVKKTSKQANLKYWSTNPKIAKVSSNGKITGVKKGTCYIYVMARNGKKVKVKITIN